MNSDTIAILIILLFACVLMGWYTVEGRMEGFESGEGQMCGVDMAPCAHGTKCMNGYCVSLAAPMLPTSSGLTVEPSDLGNPGGFLHTE